jgi:glycosyltransferase involved in cell wall biosynthesis
MDISCSGSAGRLALPEGTNRKQECPRYYHAFQETCREGPFPLVCRIMKLSIAVPVYNEVATVEQILGKIAAVDAGVDKEIITVDDCSTDGTRDLLRTLREKHPEWKFVFHDVNRGKGAALRSAFKAATGDIIIVQDADLEYDPKDYRTLLGPILDGHADVVYGSRFLGGGPHRVSFFWHSLGNRFLTTFSNMMTDLNLTDMEVCYKMFKKEVLDGMTLTEDRFGFEVEVTAKVARGKKWRIYEVPVSYYGRSYAEGKKITWRDGCRAIWCIIKYRFV